MSLPIRWMTLGLEMPGGPQLFETTRDFWATVAPQAAGYLTVTAPTDDAPRPGRSSGPDGACSLRLLLASGSPGSSFGSPLEVARDEALALGAVLGAHGVGVVQLNSPGGYGFSLSVAEGVAAPEVPSPVALGHGGLSRPDQLCLDIPPLLFTAECAFWQAITGWRLYADDEDTEFAHLDQPAQMPLRFLLQRRDDAEPGDVVTGHVDFSSADRSALAQEHVNAGASLVGEWESWISLRDPAGRIYCLTAREPRS